METLTTTPNWLAYVPLLNTVLIPLVGLGVHKLTKINSQLARHGQQLLQMKTVCKLTHPDRPDMPTNGGTSY